MTKLNRINVLFILSVLAGCSTAGTENSRIDYKTAAVKVPALEVPPDLTAPTPANQFLIPGDESVDVDAVNTNLSDYCWK